MDTKTTDRKFPLDSRSRSQSGTRMQRNVRKVRLEECVCSDAIDLPVVHNPLGTKVCSGISKTVWQPYTTTLSLST